MSPGLGILAAVPGALGADGAAVALAALAGVALALAIAVAVLARRLRALRRHVGLQSDLDARHAGPAVGEAAPPLEGLRRAGDELVAFVSEGCVRSVGLVAGLRGLEAEGMAVRWVREGEEREAFRRWRVPATPFVVYLVDGRVMSAGMIGRIEQVHGLIDAGLEREHVAA